MSALAAALGDYLALRRGLGSELRGPAGLLRRFVEFADREGAMIVTTELALRWARAPVAATPATYAARLGHVRRFARWLSGATDPRTEVPPAGLLPARYRRRPPYLYRDGEVARLVTAAERLPLPRGLRAPTYATLFGLLAATGLRLGEALALERDDVDPAGGLLIVRHGKFGKARFVPVQPSTGLLPLRARHPDHRVERPLHVRARLARRGPAGADAGRPTRPRAAAARPAAPPGHGDARALVPEGTRRGARAAETLHLSGARPRRRHLLVPRGRAGAPGARHRAGHPRPGGQAVTAPEFPALLEAFFTDRLLRERAASPHTVAAYRTTFRLLLRFAATRLGRAPSRLVLADLDAAFLGAFLEHLERKRGNCARSRNARLAALHAFSATWRSTSPPTRCAVGAFWRSPPSVSSAAAWSS